MAYDIYEEPVGAPQGWADDKNAAEYKRLVKVVFDSPVSNIPFVASLPEFARMYAGHPDDPLAQLRRVTPRQTDDPSVWDVEFTYSRVMSDERQAKPPLERPPEVDWDAHLYERSMNYDIYGNMICDSVGFPLVDEKMDDSRCIATIGSNVQETPSDIMQFRNKINSSSFTLDGVFVEEKCAKIQSIKISGWKHEEAVYFRRCTITIEIREPFVVSNASYGTNNGSTGTIGSAARIQAQAIIQGWQRALLDQGHLYGQSSTKQPFLDSAGLVMSRPGLLDGNGGKLAFLTTAVGLEYYRIYDVYPAVDFSPLNLPTSTQ